MRRGVDHRPSVFLSIACACACACAGTATLGQTPDDTFYGWDLEKYRLYRTPDEPSGAILPLPTRVGGEKKSTRFYSSTEIEAAKITQPRVAEDESNGLSFPDGARLRMGIGSVIPVGHSFGIQLGGRFMSEEHRGTRGEWLDRSAYWSSDHLEVRAGLTRSFWGDGYEGSLLLGRTAPPLEMLRVRSVQPTKIPGLGDVGRFHGSFFLAYLNDGARTIPDPLFQGTRLEWEPCDWVRFSVARTIVLGGAGRTQRLNLSDVWGVLIDRNENRKDSRDYRDSDQIASLGLELRLPPGFRESSGGLLEGGRAFYEYAGEDGFHGLLPRAPAHFFGLSIASHGWLGLTEFAETVNPANPWYLHWTYGTDAYLYRGYPLGHPMWSDGRSRHVRIWTPTWDTMRAQVWWRLRGNGTERPGEARREGSIGIGLRHDLESGRMLEAEFEGYRESGWMTPRIPPPVRWRALIGVRVGSIGTSSEP